METREAIASRRATKHFDPFELAIKLARMGVKYTQPDASVREKLREAYAQDVDGLVAASHVVAVNFQTVAAANTYWRYLDRTEAT